METSAKDALNIENITITYIYQGGVLCVLVAALFVDCRFCILGTSNTSNKDPAYSGPKPGMKLSLTSSVLYHYD
jgi:hypothetical protein